MGSVSRSSKELCPLEHVTPLPLRTDPLSDAPRRRQAPWFEKHQREQRGQCPTWSTWPVQLELRLGPGPWLPSPVLPFSPCCFADRCHGDVTVDHKRGNSFILSFRGSATCGDGAGNSFECWRGGAHACGSQEPGLFHPSSFLGPATGVQHRDGLAARPASARKSGAHRLLARLCIFVCVMCADECPEAALAKAGRMREGRRSEGTGQEGRGRGGPAAPRALCEPTKPAAESKLQANPREQRNMYKEHISPENGSCRHLVYF